MAKSCDFLVEKGSRYYCILKDSEISDSTYKDYCKYDDSRKCPIFIHYEKERR